MTTQFANASYQEVIDLHTESDKVSVVGLHTPNSDTPVHMLKGFWEQFRKFKYNGCSISLVPAAQLPADPLSVSYEAGEPTIDPRDLLNPILFHGCHGNDMGAILNNLYSADGAGDVFDFQSSDSVDHNILPNNIYSGDFFENLYYRALTDKTWLKAHPLRGFRKSGLHPMIYQVASTVQLNNVYYNASTGKGNPIGTVHDDEGVEYNRATGTIFDDAGTVKTSFGFGRPVFDPQGGGSISSSQTATPIGFVTPRLTRLGWMDTKQVVGSGGTISTDATVGGQDESDTLWARHYLAMNDRLSPVCCPKVFMGMIMLPPAYKTEQYYRLIINHSFSFAKFRGASMITDNIGEMNNAYSVFNFNDPESKKGGDDEPDKAVE